MANKKTSKRSTRVKGRGKSANSAEATSTTTTELQPSGTINHPDTPPVPPAKKRGGGKRKAPGNEETNAQSTIAPNITDDKGMGVLDNQAGAQPWRSGGVNFQAQQDMMELQTKMAEFGTYVANENLKLMQSLVQQVTGIQYVIANSVAEILRAINGTDDQQKTTINPTESPEYVKLYEQYMQLYNNYNALNAQYQRIVSTQVGQRPTVEYVQ